MRRASFGRNLSGLVFGPQLPESLGQDAIPSGISGKWKGEKHVRFLSSSYAQEIE